MRALATMAILTGAALLLSGCKTSPYEYSQNPYEYSGVRLYQVYCSSCHGLTGLGDGPVQPLLRGGVPDLTKLAARRAGKFPRAEIREIIDGREGYLAHGTSRMPVWGFEFYSGSDPAARQRADRMIGRISDYLESLQTPAAR